MKIRVVTSFSWIGHEVYGQRMIDSFAKHWPDDVELCVYYEGELPMNSEEWVKWVSLDADMDRAAFMAKHTDHPIDYRKQPVKFCHKVFAITDNCLRDYQHLKGQGVHFEGEPNVMPYGTGVTLHDLYGNKIYLNEEPA